MAEEKQTEPKVIVVDELPVQKINQMKSEEGEDIILITVSQALTEIIHSLKKVEKAVV